MKAKKTFVVIAYDISSNRKRSKLAKELEKYGKRINLSVFECMVTKNQMEELKKYTEKLIIKKTDSVLFYRICLDCYTKIYQIPKARSTAKKIIVV